MEPSHSHPTLQYARTLHSGVGAGLGKGDGGGVGKGAGRLVGADAAASIESSMQISDDQGGWSAHRGRPAVIEWAGRGIA